MTEKRYSTTKYKPLFFKFAEMTAPLSSGLHSLPSLHLLRHGLLGKGKKRPFTFSQQSTKGYTPVQYQCTVFDRPYYYG